METKGNRVSNLDSHTKSGLLKTYNFSAKLERLGKTTLLCRKEMKDFVMASPQMEIESPSKFISIDLPSNGYGF